MLYSCTRPIWQQWASKGSEFLSDSHTADGDRLESSERAGGERAWSEAVHHEVLPAATPSDNRDARYVPVKQQRSLTDDERQTVSNVEHHRQLNMYRTNLFFLSQTS